ncbi:nonribosomal peptide synthetase [Ilyonectria robusta]
MASEGYYAATESLVLDTEVDHFGPLGHALWSIIANMYHHSGEWILNSLSEQDRQWEHSYRLVNINDSTTIDDLLQTQQLKVAPNKIQDVDDTFCIAVRNSGIPVPRWSSGVGQAGTSYDIRDKPTAQILYPQPKNAEPARTLLKSFYAAWQGLRSPSIDSSRRISELSVLASDDIRQFELLNSRTLRQQNECLHDVVVEHARQTPTASAVRAWDGHLTYSELDDHASRIANMLRSMGIRDGDFIPSIMEKSYWSIVAMLATLKAGAVFVPIDPKSPASRTNSILLQIAAKLYFTNLGPEMRRKLNPSVVFVDAFEEIVAHQWPAHPVTSRPSDLATCFFTSGSTGTPKGVIHDHAAICTGAMELLPPMYMDNQTSCLHFVSPGFDVSVSEIFATLYGGGCVCVPSEQGKLNNLNGEMRALEVTHAFLTPSVAGQLNPSEIPTLKYVILGGEALDRDTLKALCSDVHLINAYGCTESGLWDTASERLDLHSSPSNVGSSTGPRTWIVHPDNHDHLLHFGAVGEVLVESFATARGYIGDRRAKSGFVATPKWRPQLLPGHEHGRFYLTGDLGSFNPDGSIELHGRKDTQSKIRGQRIELGEIEHHLRQAFPSFDVVAEIVTIGQLEARTAIAAFVAPTKAPQYANTKGQSVYFDQSSIKSIQAARVAATSALSAALPAYMVPEIYIPISQVPLSMSGKTDRRALRQLAQAISKSDMAALHGVGENKDQPSNERERLLQSVWAAIFRVEAGVIGIHDHFLRIGGDSISAMKVVAAARDRGLLITVAHLLQHPTIALLARVARLTQDAHPSAAVTMQ